jgi:uncharacterized membrane protein YdbT with pleckstrin-like domain
MLEASRRFSSVELWVQAVLRVPPCPEPPEGSPESVQVFHPGRNYYTLCLLVWFVTHFLILAGLVAAHMIIAAGPLRGMPEWGRITLRIVEWLAALAFTASAAFTFISQRLNYYLRWYIITDRSLRIRTGVLNIQELTMTFSNIQEIRVSAGPIQNFLKLADVEVQSAGGGSKDGEGHIGRFHSVSNANAIRDLMVERLRHYRDSGLGEPAAHVGPASDSAIDAALAVLAEARALHEQAAISL